MTISKAERRADVAQRQLDGIVWLVWEDGSLDYSCARFHQADASNCMAAMVAAGRPLPETVRKNVVTLALACKWRFPPSVNQLTGE